MDRQRNWAWLLACALGTAAPWPMAARAQGADEPAAAEDDARERLGMERFLSLLEKNPRRGTALDRVYGYHVERGTLDRLIRTYEDRVKEDPKDGKSWLLIGLFEAQRGRDAAAVAALRKAEEARADDPLPSYYLGQALVLVGQPDAAVDAFERAIARGPNRADLLEIYQALGRVHQRAHHNDKALAVWERLETQFPDDLRVQEEIAAALAEESDPSRALPRYEALAKKATDPFRRVQYKMDAAELKVRLGKQAEALKDFEGLLGQLNPESWLHREVRRKVEDVFLKTDDQAGLSAYYEGWLKTHAEDVEAMSRLGRSLATQGRIADAKSRFEKAVKLAPSRRELRQALIEQLVFEKKYAEAAKQYEAMAKADPNNPDVVRDWGRLILRDESRPEPERKQAAAAVWRKLVEAKPKDAAIAVQVADLLRQAEMPDEAIALYKKAIELAPNAPQYHEYLGEYFHNLKRKDEALAAWAKLAEGKNRNAKNLARLAEVLAGFGYQKEALAPIAEACKLDPDDYESQFKYADLLAGQERFDDALAQLDRAEKAADDPQQVEAAFDLRIKVYQAANTLADRINELKKALDAGTDANAERWRRLAKLYEADHKLPEATGAVGKAVVQDPKSVNAWLAYARIHEATGDLGGAADAYRTLATLDRRALTEYLTEVAKLEQRLGRRDRALKAGRDLLAAAPGNPESYQFFADLCMQLGAPEEGLDALRRAVRVNPSDTKALLTLGEALAREFRTEEAIELYWRAFDREKGLDGKVGIVPRLTELYLQRNQFDRLVGRLEREGREANAPARETAICLAAAYQASGDNGTARAELERLLASNPRDTALLGQLSSLAEAEGDLAVAAKYQAQLNEIAPTDEGAGRLAQLYLRAGEADEAEAIWTRLASGKQDLARILQTVDNLLAHGKPETVLGITERLLREQPNQWDALYREAVALAALDKRAEAARRFQAILDLRRDDNEESEPVKAAQKNANKGRPAGARAANARPSIATVYFQGRPMSQGVPLQNRIGMTWQIRQAAKLDNNNNYYYGGSPATWSPGDFGQAREAALAWQLALATKEDKQDAFVEARRAAAEKAPADLRARWDWYYLAQVRQEAKEVYEAARALAIAAPEDPAALWAYLSSLQGRDTPSGPQVYRANNQDTTDKTPPLPAAEMDRVLAAYKTLKARQPDWADTGVLGILLVELRRAKRDGEADAIYKAAQDAAGDNPGALSTAIYLAGEREDVDTLLALIDRSERQAAAQGNAAQGGMAAYSYLLTNAMASAAEKKQFDTVARLFDRYFDWYAGPDQSARRAKAAAGAGNTGGPVYFGNFNVRIGKTYKQINIDFPTPNRYYDNGALQFLRTAFELYKAGDVLSDLFARVQKRLDSANGAEKAYPQLALGYLRWWNDEKDEALAALTRASAVVPDDAELKMELAEIRSKRNEPDEALALVDSFDPTDQKTLQRREILALRLAVLTGNVERARQASERLFNLRLDTNTQLQLAAQMHQLGMHELAEAVLARARRRAGNNATTLVTLMQQYQQQNKVDTAVQVAHQILRRSATRQFRPYQDENDTAQRAAIQVLARSGKLKDLIARVEAQLKASPNSMQLLQSLADYQKAAGDKDGARRAVDRMVALKPDDAKLRYQVGMDLVQAGDVDAALPHLKTALKKEPQLFGYRYWEIQNAFQQANKQDELIELIDSMDLKQVGNYWSVSQIASEVMRNEKTRAQGLKLFRKMWAAYVNERPYLLSNFYDDAIWKLPEMYDFAREAVIPAESAKNYSPWQGVDSLNSYSSGGKGSGVANHLLDAAAAQNKLEPLLAEVQKAATARPNWPGGRAMEAAILARRGKLDDAGKIVQELLDRAKEQPIPNDTRQFLGQELEDHEKTKKIALALYEGAAFDDDQNGREFEWHPIRRLIALYKKDGRGAEARDLVLKFYRKADDRNGYDPAYAAYRRMSSSLSIGTELIELGYPVDAVEVFDAVLADKDAHVASQRFSGNNDYMIRRAREGLDRALTGLNDQTLAPTVRALVRPAGDGKEGGSGPALNLVLLVHPRDLSNAALSSLFAQAITRAAKKPELKKEVAAALAEQREKHPNDLTVAVAEALLAAADDKAEPLAEAAGRLARLADDAPLEDLSEGARPNARQRAEAAERLGLWLVARACGKHESTRALGERLSAQAIEGARRQADPLWSLAMLREGGQIALDRGDRAGAERSWSRMLDLLLAHANASPAPAKPADGKAPGKGAAAPALTLERFEMAVGVARLAAEHDMTGLSLRAVREPLRHGPPVIPMPIDTNNNQGMIVRSSNGPDDQQGAQVSLKVEESLSGLDNLWARRKAPPAEVYAALREAVLPAARPDEVFLYPRPLSYGAEHPRDAALILARWAARAEKLDDLKAAIAARRSKPMAEMNALVLLGRVALAAKDAELRAKTLADLEARLKKDTLQTSAELACHAAVPTLAADPASAPARAVVEAALANLSASQSTQPQAGLHLVLARSFADAGQSKEARAQIKAFDDVTVRTEGRYVGDYAFYHRKQHLATVAGEYARAGLWADVLENLGLFVDTPAYSGGDPSLGNLFARLARQLAERPARERYDTLRAWSLPTEGRKSVRILASSVPADAPPPAFGTFPAGAFDSGLASTAGILIDAAKEAGTLDELVADATKLAADKVENGEALLALVQSSRGQLATMKDRLKPMAEALRKKGPNANNRVDPLQWTDLLVTRAMLRDPATADELGKPTAFALIGRAQNAQNWSFLGQARRDLGAGQLTIARDTADAPGDDPGLAMWHPATTVDAGQHAAGAPPVWWVAHDGLVKMLTSPGDGYLLFDAPVAGTFEFSVDVYTGGWAEGNAGYGGLVAEACSNGVPSGVFPPGRSERVPLPSPFMNHDQFNRMTIQVAPDKVRYLANGHLFYEDDDPSPTAPWLLLFCGRERQSSFRRAELKGNPEVPREVKLTHGDRLEGWVGGFYGEGQPPRRSVAKDDPRRLAASSAAGREDLDWSAADGVIYGRHAESDRRDPVESRLYYFRPLRDGESVSYEFYHDPGSITVHPALDRVAFLLEPGGVRLHWMTDGPNAEWTGLKTDNAADVPAERRGPAELPLKAGEWNAASVALQGDEAVLTLNGVEVYRRKLETGNSRQFGFFRHRDRVASQVRQVVLRGNWPERIEPAQVALAPKGGADRLADVRVNARRDLIGEDRFELGTEDALRTARALPLAERYAYLRDWVFLPNWPEFRVSGRFTQTDAAPPVASPAPSPPYHPAPRRSHTGGQLESPALELIAAAKELGKLDELATRIDQAMLGDDFEKRNRFALLALVRAAQGRDDDAEAALKQLIPLVQAEPLDAQRWVRWPEQVAHWGLAENPRLREASRPLIDAMVKHWNDMLAKSVWINERQEWGHQVLASQTRADFLAESAEQRARRDVDARLPLWSRVTRGSASTRGQGDPLPRWLLREDNILQHRAGHFHDYLYFNAPIRGDFEVTGELTALGFNQMQVSYSGRTAQLRWDAKAVEVHTFFRDPRNADLSPPVEAKDWYPFRLVMKGGSLEYHFSGRKVHEEPLPPNRDPWLSIHQDVAGSSGLRHLKIAGSPTVPESLDLIVGPVLTGWLPYHDYERIGGDNPTWSRAGEAIVGHRFGSDGPPPVDEWGNVDQNKMAKRLTPGSAQESLLQYHRPMLEDGRITYEFWYEPGRAAVHPALDRLAFLVEPDGVSVHWITDGRFERTGLSPENRTVETSNRRGPAKLPLKPGAWNRLELELAGDVATLKLNEDLIYERPLEPTNPRTFGLYHESDRTEARVRHVTYSGRWPRTVPADLGFPAANGGDAKAE